MRVSSREREGENEEEENVPFGVPVKINCAVLINISGRYDNYVGNQGYPVEAKVAQVSENNSRDGALCELVQIDALEFPVLESREPVLRRLSQHLARVLVDAVIEAVVLLMQQRGAEQVTQGSEEHHRLLAFSPSLSLPPPLRSLSVLSLSLFFFYSGFEQLLAATHDSFLAVLNPRVLQRR